MRALPGDSLANFCEMVAGKTAGPLYVEVLRPVVDRLGLGAGAALGAAVLGAAPMVPGEVGAGAAAASPSHSAFRKSFHFIPPSVPADFAARYFVLHSCIVSACAGAGKVQAQATSATAPTDIE